MGQMSAEARQESIVDEVLVNGRVSVTALAERHSVTVETIRRDLTALDRRGALRKVHGGAVATSAVAAPETAVIEREQSHAQAKRAMARVAVGALDLGAGDRLILDAGTSVAALVPLLPPGMPLTIITSSVLTASALAPQEHLSVRILGGQVRGLTQAAVGPEALATLATLRVDTAVIGANREDSEFFIRKTIGWALRDYARTDGDWVRAFVQAHPDLSPLSRREALKRL